MSDAVATRISCTGCQRTYAWKPELAGRRVKCKCGHVMLLPIAPPVAEPEQEELYDLAPSEDDVKQAFSHMNAATTSGASAPVSSASAPSNPGIPLAYQKGPTQRERERFSAKTLMDMKRDVYSPVALLLLGFIIYAGFYMYRYQMNATGIAVTTLGLGILTVLKAALLIGFAFTVAGPLGVSFGGVWTAIVKLAAIAVFSDGITTWVDAGTARISGGTGAFSGMLSFPVAMGIWWFALIYLFSMDSGDSWLVVIILCIFDFFVRFALLMLLLHVILGWGGVSPAAMPLPALGGGPPAGAVDESDSIALHVRDLKEQKLLMEAREFIAGGRQAALGPPTDAWYAAGAKNVWFEIDYDAARKIEAVCVIVELPKEKEKREKCFAIIKEFYEAHDFSYDEEDLKDDGSAFVVVQIR